MVTRANGATSLGIRPRDEPEERTLEIVLPTSAWKLIDDQARETGHDAASAISQLIGDMCWQANAPQPRVPAQARQSRRRAARTE
jgi:hypothetical protein